MTTPADLFAAKAITKTESYKTRHGPGKLQRWLDDCDDADLKAVVLERLMNVDVATGSIRRGLAELDFSISDSAITLWRDNHVE